MPRHGLSVIDELESEGAIRVTVGDCYGKTIRHFHSLRPPDELPLNEGQREIVEYWIKHIADEHTATSISEQSHDYAWEIAALGEEIPYHAIFATRSIGLPTVTVVYEIKPFQVVVHDALFADARYGQAGRA